MLGLQWACSPEKAMVVLPPNVYLTINPDGTVLIVAHRQEMGTGIRTGLPMIVADELEADWKRVKLVQAVGDEKSMAIKIPMALFRYACFLNLCAKQGPRPG